MEIPKLNSSFTEIYNLLELSHLPKIINTSIDMEVLEAFGDAELTAKELADKLQTKESITESLLDVLVHLDILSKDDYKYKLNNIAKEFLLKDSPACQLMTLKRYSGSVGVFDHLDKALKGKTPEFDYNFWSSEQALTFMEYGAKAGDMQNIMAFADKLPEFHKAEKMCDIAGSSGYYSFALMQLNKKLESDVYELPKVCELSRKLKQNEPDFNRIKYIESDVKTANFISSDYDLILSSHFLYEFIQDNRLEEFFKIMNRAMKTGGLFISNHVGIDNKENSTLKSSILELMTRTMGYYTHSLPERQLELALRNAGFGNFNTNSPDKNNVNSNLLLSAVKIKNI